MTDRTKQANRPRHNRKPAQVGRRLLTEQEAKAVFVELGKRDMTVAALGSHLGVGPHAVSSWLQRKCTAPLTSIDALRTLLAIP